MAAPHGERVDWTVRILLLLLLVASPWPFGSATPLPSAFLSAALYVLFGIWVAFLLIKKTDLQFPWPGHRWLALGLLFGLFQLLPLAPSLLGALAPASATIHYPAAAEAQQALGTGWRSVSIEPFATEAELLRLGALIAAFYLFSHLFLHRRDIRLLGYSVSFLGVALSLFAVYQQARWGTLLYGRFPVPSVNPFEAIRQPQPLRRFHRDVCVGRARGRDWSPRSSHADRFDPDGWLGALHGSGPHAVSISGRLSSGRGRRCPPGHPRPAQQSPHARVGPCDLGRRRRATTPFRCTKQRLPTDRIDRSCFPGRLRAIPIAPLDRFTATRPAIAHRGDGARYIWCRDPSLPDRPR